MNHTIKTRISALERRLHPEPKGGPLRVLFHHVNQGMTETEFAASMKAGDAEMAAAAARAGGPVPKTAAEENAAYLEHLKHPGPDPTLLIEVVHVPGERRT